jgi:uncharacterized protein DUF3180
MTPSEPPTRPTMQPTSLATLSVAALATAALSWLAISRFYGDMPRLPWLPALTLCGLALVEAVTAPSTKARIDRKKGTVPVNPLVVARYVVLAKASSLAGALFTGLYGGILLWLIAERGRLAAVNNDLPQVVVGSIGALGLVLAALWLERSCRVPPSPEDETRPLDDWIDEERPGGDRSGGGRPSGA